MNKTKKLLIDITFSLLYKRGYCATSITDIQKESKITKGAIYYHFKSKNDLILSSIKYYLEELYENLWFAPLRDTSDPLDTILKQISTLCEHFSSKNHYLNVENGSPLGVFIADMSDKDEVIAQYLRDVTFRLTEAMCGALNGITVGDFNAKTESKFIVSSIEGAMVCAKAYNSIESLCDSLQLTSCYVKQITQK